MSKVTGIKAKMLEHFSYESLFRSPGSFCYMPHESGIIFSCPCGCGALSGIYGTCSGPYGTPTLSQPVNIKLQTKLHDVIDITREGFHWRGWLRDGVWLSA